jgi:uncharacterized protein YndB with AHSA1/START domain
MEFEARATIAKPREFVWKMITYPGGWKTWYGGELKRVDPEWQEGAELVWANGNISEITEFIPLKVLGWGSSVKCQITLTEEENGSTALVYSEKVGGHLSVSNPSAKQAQCNSTTRDLKNYVESSSGGGGCFIATAAYGTSTAQEVIELQNFRDYKLRKTYYGGLAIRVYEAVSPPIARFISTRNLLRLAVRNLFIIPLVTLIRQAKRSTK